MQSNKVKYAKTKKNMQKAMGNALIMGIERTITLSLNSKLKIFLKTPIIP